MEVSEGALRWFQQHLGYSDEEMELFRARPENLDVVAKGPELMRKTIIVEVVESHGCNSQHKVGDRFIFDGAGNLLTAKCPQRICFGALHGLGPLIFATSELAYAGVDPGSLRFNRTGCIDVGVRCGGWGHIVLDVRVEDRDAAQEPATTVGSS
jgi:uncharacterized repeat protein (TIGR04076 family)